MVAVRPWRGRTPKPLRGLGAAAQSVKCTVDLETRFILAGVFLVGIWIVPAIIYTDKIKNSDDYSSHTKRQLLFYLWLAPLIGWLICVVMFSKMGKLRRISESEHRSFWYFW